MVPVAGIYPVGDTRIGGGHHDPHPAVGCAGRVLAVDVAPAPEVVGEVLHPVVAQLEVPLLAVRLGELHHQRGAGLQPPVAELEVAVVGRPSDALVPLLGVLQLVLAGQQVPGPPAVVAEQPQHQLRGHGQPDRHVVRLGRGRAGMLVEAADLQAGRRLGAAVGVDDPAHELAGLRRHREPHLVRAGVVDRHNEVHGAVGRGQLGQHETVGGQRHVRVEATEEILGPQAGIEGADIVGDGRAPRRQVGVGAAERARDPVAVTGVHGLDDVVLVGRLHALPAPQRGRDEPDRPGTGTGDAAFDGPGRGHHDHAGEVAEALHPVLAVAVGGLAKHDATGGLERVAEVVPGSPVEQPGLPLGCDLLRVRVHRVLP